MGPPPTSIYFWAEVKSDPFGPNLCRASSKESNLVGVEMAKDLGRSFRSAAEKEVSLLVEEGLLLLYRGKKQNI